MYDKDFIKRILSPAPTPQKEVADHIEFMRKQKLLEDAAEDMLYALKLVSELSGYFPSTDFGINVLEVVNGAIAKAEGRE